MSDIAKELEIDDANLARELAEQAARFVYAAEKAIAAEKSFNDFKLKVAELYAVLDRDIRSAAEADKRKLTEKAIEGEITVTPEYSKALAHLGRLKANMDILKAHREGWRERGSMLVQLCAMKRTEMETISFDSMKAA